MREVVGSLDGAGPTVAAAVGRDHRILHTLSDPTVQGILLLINDLPRSAQEIAEKNHLPTSSLYRKLHELRTLGLAAIQLSVLTSAGKRVHMYRSLVEEFRVEMLGGSVRVHVRYRDLATERLRSMWESVREEARGP